MAHARDFGIKDSNGAGAPGRSIVSNPTSGVPDDPTLMQRVSDYVDKFAELAKSTGDEWDELCTQTLIEDELDIKDPRSVSLVYATLLYGIGPIQVLQNWRLAFVMSHPHVEAYGTW